MRLVLDLVGAYRDPELETLEAGHHALFPGLQGAQAQASADAVFLADVLGLGRHNGLVGWYRRRDALAEPRLSSRRDLGNRFPAGTGEAADASGRRRYCRFTGANSWFGNL